MNPKLFSVALVTFGLATRTAFAANTATDTAANYAAGGWGNSPPNNGSGFGAWSIQLQNNNSPPFVGTYLDTSGNFVSTGGYAFGTFANGGGNNGAINLTRLFTANPSGYQDPSGLGTLYNQTFSISLASGGVGNGNSGPPNSAFGFSLMTGQGAGATAALTLQYAGTQANDNMILTDNHGTDNTTVPVNFGNLNAGLRVSIAVGANPDGLNPYTITISPVSGGSPLYTYSGDTSGPLQEVNVFDSNTTGNGYFNDLDITSELAVPEPSSLVLFGISGLALLFHFRRRK